MNGFDLLDPASQPHVVNTLGWPALRRMQARAIRRIEGLLNTSNRASPGTRKGGSHARTASRLRQPTGSTCSGALRAIARHRWRVQTNVDLREGEVDRRDRRRRRTGERVAGHEILPHRIGGVQTHDFEDVDDVPPGDEEVRVSACRRRLKTEQ